MTTPENPDGLVMFANVAHAAMCEAGHPDVYAPAFAGRSGQYWLEFDTDDYPQDSDEFRCLLKAEALAQEAVRRWHPSPRDGGYRHVDYAVTDGTAHV